MKRFAAAFALSATLSLLGAGSAQAQDAPKPAAKENMTGGCDSFTWDVSHELDVLGKPAQPITAGKDGKKPVHLDLDQHYAAKLLPQSAVHYAVKPGKATSEGEYGGVFSFHALKPGRYRISVTSEQWVDVADGPLLVVSQDFQGARGCQKLRKVVQFELSGNKNFVLQLSGGMQANVDLAITQLKAD